MESSTPRARPHLSNFSNRKYMASPLGHQNRISTPLQQQPTARKLTTREEFARGALNASSALQPNRASSNGSSSRATMPDIFAPGASPAVKKIRSSAASPTPSPSRGGASKSSSSQAELFVQRIPDPPQDLTGEALAQKIPRHLQSTNVYADQYLAHLVPKDFNDEQRRQFFCILDCRRLKVAATEIFAKKDWKLNIMNFAKEFEKSRSMIMLRYGLYEFKNVKPSAEVLRKWRAAHGLPDPQDDDHSDGGRTNGFPSATKRKAESQLTKDAGYSTGSPNKSRRRMYADESAELDRGSAKNKRKTFVEVDDEEGDDEQQQPSKLHKSASATKSLFQSVADNSGTFRTPDFFSQSERRVPDTAPVSKPNIFNDANKPSLFASTAKPSSNGNSIFDKPKSSGNGENIFGYLSDKSGQNSANADSSDDEAAAEAPVKPTGGLFGSSKMTATATNTDRSLFGRVGSSKEDAGKPADKPAVWTAGTPIKFAPASTTTSGLFGAQPSSQESNKTEATALFSFNSQPNTAQQSGSSLFQKETDPKPSGGLFGASKPTEEAASSATPSLSFTQAPAAIFGPPNTSSTANLFQGSYTAPNSQDRKPSVSPAPTTQASPPPEAAKNEPPPSAIFGTAPTLSSSDLFKGSYTNPAEQPKPSTAGLFGAPKPAESTSAAGLFGAKPAESSTAGLFGAKPAESSTAGLFGAKPAGSSTAGLFGAKPAESTPASGLFGAKSAESTPASGLFGASTPATTAAPAGGLFGVSTPATAAPTGGLFGASTPATTAAAPAGGLFGASTPATTAPAGGLFGATTAAPSTAGLFGAGTPASTAGGGLFGATTTTAAPAPVIFGGSQPAAAPPVTPSKPSVMNNAPIFSFGGADKPAEATNLFGTNNGPFGGSPMKTDDNSPVKKPAPVGTNAPIFSFGGSNTPSNPPAATNIFGNNNAATPIQPTGNIFSNTSFAVAPSAATPTANTSFSFGAGGGGNNNATQSFNNPFANNASTAAPANPISTTSSFDFNFGGNNEQAAPNANSGASFTFGGNNAAPSTPTGAANNVFSFDGNTGAATAPAHRVIATPRRRGASPAVSSAKKPFRAGSVNPGATPGGSQPTFNFGAPTPQIALPTSFAFGQQPQQQQQQQQQQPGQSIFSNLSTGGPSTSGANASLLLGGNTSTGTTPAAATPEPSSNQAEAGDEEPPQEQINLTSGGPGEEDEETLHEVRAKALRFIAPGADENGKKADSPWVTQGVGPLRLLKNKTTGLVRLLLRAQPSGKVALNRTVMAGETYKANEKFVRITTSNDTGTGLETWTLQVKTKDMAAELAAALETHKSANKK